MNSHLLVPLALLAAPLASQQSRALKPAPVPPPLMADDKTPPPAPPVKTAVPVPTPIATPRTEPGKAAPRPTTSPRLPADAVLVDRAADGLTWVRARGYKAGFDGQGVQFVPFLGADAPRNFPLGLTLRSVRVGSQEVPFQAKVDATVADRRVTLDRGSVVEQYDLSAAGIEQSFVFATLPTDGDLVVRIAVRTELTGAAADQGGVCFANELGGVRYGAAFVLDQSRVKVPVASRFDDQTIELRVPQSYLAAATFPLTLDPLVTGFTARAGLNVIEGTPDLAYDQGSGEYLVVWEETFSAADHDIGSVRVNAAGNPIAGSVLYLDQSTTNWSHPRVASLVSVHRFLMVAAVGAAPSRTIWGRSRDAGSNSAPAAFQISGASAGDKLNPDVGGDQNSGAVFWNVVWQRNLNSTDSDIHAQLVNPDGTLFGGTLLIDNSSATLDANPSISKSDGDAPGPTQHWNIVWQREFAPGDNDIYFAQVHWNGVITTSSRGLDTSTANDTWPTASSPTDEINGERHWVACYQRDGVGQRDILARLVRANLTSTLVNLSALEPGYQSRDQITPHVDSDGCRFAIAWSEQLGGADWDIRGGTYHMVYGTTLALSEARVLFSLASETEGNPRVVANRTGGGSAARYGLIWERRINASDADVEGAVYDGLGAGGYTVLNSGCNGLGMVTGGTPALGGTAQFLMTGSGANLPMMIFSLPAPAVMICPGCSLTVNLGTAIFFSGASLSLPIPCEGAFVGGTFAVQGFTYGTGPCLNTVALSDTAQCTIR